MRHLVKSSEISLKAKNKILIRTSKKTWPSFSSSLICGDIMVKNHYKYMEQKFHSFYCPDERFCMQDISGKFVICNVVSLFFLPYHALNRARWDSANVNALYYLLFLLILQLLLVFCPCFVTRYWLYSMYASIPRRTRR